MDDSNPVVARQVARAVIDFERERTGPAPESVNVVLNDDTLVVTLQGSLSPAEKAVARNPAAGSMQVAGHVA